MGHAFYQPIDFYYRAQRKTINPPKYLNQSIIRPNVIVSPDVAYLKVLM